MGGLFWLLQGEGDGGVEELECSALGVGGLGKHGHGVVGVGFPRNREGFPYAAAGWSAASLSYWIGDINAAELCRRRLL